MNRQNAVTSICSHSCASSPHWKAKTTTLFGPVRGSTTDRLRYWKLGGAIHHQIQTPHVQVMQLGKTCSVLVKGVTGTGTVLDFSTLWHTAYLCHSVKSRVFTGILYNTGELCICYFCCSF